MKSLETHRYIARRKHTNYPDGSVGYPIGDRRRGVFSALFGERDTHTWEYRVRAVDGGKSVQILSLGGMKGFPEGEEAPTAYETDAKPIGGSQSRLYSGTFRDAAVRAARDTVPGYRRVRVTDNEGNHIKIDGKLQYITIVEFSLPTFNYNGPDEKK